MSPDILLTPPLLASRLIAGFVIPWMLSRSTFLCLFAPPFPRPFPPFPLPWSGIFSPLLLISISLFKGSYRGSQEASTGIIGLLEVIKSDFDRTARKTLQAEKKAQAEFVEFDRTSRVDIKSKETQLEIDKEELKSTKSAIDRTVEDMETAQKLLDGAVKTIEELKPMCIDTGMSYKERAAKRDEEIAALKKALCALDPDGVEEDCA